MSDRLRDQLARGPRQEEYDETLHGEDKGDWLADAFFAMETGELHAYCDFMLENTAYSTQHGVKGEEYIQRLLHDANGLKDLEKRITGFRGSKARADAKNIDVNDKLVAQSVKVIGAGTLDQN